jgi:hypothetical protein
MDREQTHGVFQPAQWCHRSHILGARRSLVNARPLLGVAARHHAACNVGVTPMMDGQSSTVDCWGLSAAAASRSSAEARRSAAAALRSLAAWLRSVAPVRCATNAVPPR